MPAAGPAIGQSGFTIGQRPGFWLAAVVLAVCLVLGGQGPHEPVASGICLIAALALAAFELLRRRPPAAGGTRWALAILVAATFVPAAQLLPLPPWIWQNLPGRDMLIETLSAAGLAADGYRPLTFDRLETSGAVLHMLPALALFIAVRRLDRRGRDGLLVVILVCALASLALGALPLGQAFDSMLDEPVRKSVSYEGFFANNNHQADFMLIAVACAASFLACGKLRDPPLLAILALLACILLMGALATGSRMGFAMAGPVLLVGGAMIWRARRGTGPTGKTGLILPLAAFLALVAWATSLSLLPRIMERLGPQALPEMRLRIVPDIVWAIGQYFPVGTGIGTFDQVFRSVERLDHVSPIYMNHAHNEYLQVLLEAGLPGGLLVVTALVWYGAAALSAWQYGDRLAQTGTIVIGIYALHSIVDYPLRTLSHAALLGMFMATMPIALRRRRRSTATDPVSS